MIVAVFDANVLVAGIGATRIGGHKPGQLLDRWLRDEFELVLSPYIVAEAERVLRTKRYFKSNLTDAEREAAIGGLRNLARIIDPVVVPGVAPHRHDDPVLAAVAASGADWFVTGDEALLAMRSYAGVPFADPARFLDVLNAVEG